MKNRLLSLCFLIFCSLHFHSDGVEIGIETDPPATNGVVVAGPGGQITFKAIYPVTTTTNVNFRGFRWDFTKFCDPIKGSKSSEVVKVLNTATGTNFTVKLEYWGTVGTNSYYCEYGTTNTTIVAPKFEFLVHSPPGETNYIASTARVKNGKVESSTDIKISTLPDFNLGKITSTRGKDDVIKPNSGSTDSKGVFECVLTTQKIELPSTRIQLFDRIKSSEHFIQFPLKYESTFLVTAYTTLFENDAAFAASPKGTTTEMKAGGVSHYYYVTSKVPARKAFLGEVAIEGFGYLDDRLTLVKTISIDQIKAPNPLPAGTNKSWKFFNVKIDVTQGLPKGNAGNDLIDGVSAAIVRKGKAGVVIPNKAAFKIDGRNETRIADDTVTGSRDEYHIDIYIIDSRDNIQRFKIPDAIVTLIQY